MNEKVLERKLAKALKDMGHWCEKYTNPFRTGYPDRLCFCAGGSEVFFVEVKTTGEKLRKLQLVRKAELNKLGYVVFIVDSEKAIEEVKSYVTHVQKHREAATREIESSNPSITSIQYHIKNLKRLKKSFGAEI